MALSEGLKGVQESFYRPLWLRSRIMSLFQGIRFAKHGNFLRDYGKKVIQERQEAIALGEDTPSDILDYILRVAQADPTLTLEYLIDEFVTFFLAG